MFDKEDGSTLLTQLAEGEVFAQPLKRAPSSANAAMDESEDADNSSDFIRSYVRYADVIEAPPETHEIVATQLIATALNPNVHIEPGAVRIPLDLWTLILSGSGFGRNTLVGLARPIMVAAKLDRLILDSTWGSSQAFHQNIAEHPNGLFVWPEFSVFLKKFQDSRFAGAKEWLTDRYDNLDVPEEIRYRKTGKSGDTPPITFNCAPRRQSSGAPRQPSGHCAGRNRVD